MYNNKSFDNNMNIRILTAILKSLWKVWSTSFLTNIKIIVIPSFISILNFLFKKYVLLQLRFFS